MHLPTIFVSSAAPSALLFFLLMFVLSSIFFFCFEHTSGAHSLPFCLRFLFLLLLLLLSSSSFFFFFFFTFFFLALFCLFFSVFFFFSSTQAARTLCPFLYGFLFLLLLLLSSSSVYFCQAHTQRALPFAHFFVNSFLGSSNALNELPTLDPDSLPFCLRFSVSPLPPPSFLFFYFFCFKHTSSAHSLPFCLFLPRFFLPLLSSFLFCFFLFLLLLLFFSSTSSFFQSYFFICIVYFYRAGNNLPFQQVVVHGFQRLPALGQRFHELTKFLGEDEEREPKTQRGKRRQNVRLLRTRGCVCIS